MKALYTAGDGAGLVWADRPEPHAGAGEVKIRVHRTGICGTDLHIDSWDAWAQREITGPLIPGHEFFGEVVALGPGVRDIQVGAHVSGEGHVVCGTCRNCRAGRRHMCIRTRSVGLHRNGAFAEYVVIPESNVWVHPPGMDPDVGAIFDPLGNAVHTALAFGLEGEDVIITGAGPIGLMAAAIARHVGARYVVVTDISDERLHLAADVGADLAVNVCTSSIADAQRKMGMQEGFDVGMEMSGSPQALPEMIDNMNHGGSIAILGLPSQPIQIDWAKVVTHMITIKGIYGREMYESWYKMSSMLASGTQLQRALSAVITHRVPAREWAEGFAVARSGRGGKVVIDWTDIEGA